MHNGPLLLRVSIRKANTVSVENSNITQLLQPEPLKTLIFTSKSVSASVAKDPLAPHGRWGVRDETDAFSFAAHLGVLLQVNHEENWQPENQ
jgi:hypothetical protein